MMMIPGGSERTEVTMGASLVNRFSHTRGRHIWKFAIVQAEASQ